MDKQEAVVTLIVGFAVGWIGIKIWRFLRARRRGGQCPGCGKCGND